MSTTLPRVLAIDRPWKKGDRVQQLALPPTPIAAQITPFTRGRRLTGFLMQPDGAEPEVLLVPDARGLEARDHHVLQWGSADPPGADDLRTATWLRHPLSVTGAIDFAAVHAAVQASWRAAFSFPDRSSDAGVPGLRTPQIGALHAVHAHWTTSSEPATIVLPTGTGKTDTMLAVLVSAACTKVLVVVPTDALRTQLAEKFLTLGVLPAHVAGVLRPGALYPVVGTLSHRLISVAEADALLVQCQVLVTTSSIAGQLPAAIQAHLAARCSHLFIDEAHHAEAPTWRAFRERFQSTRVLQFTATPYREDGAHIEGRLIYEFPLKQAQEHGYFRRIRFDPVVEFNPERADAAIAERAVARLRADAPFKHVLLARVASLERVREVFPHYAPYTEFGPVQLHTGLPPHERAEARRRILAGEARIVVCVDMLGEGFDLPELKIAAFHDVRKSPAVTLQLAGRFVRARADLGDPTFIANIADVSVRTELQKLYTRDPDWNALLPELSAQFIREQLALQDFLASFSELPKELRLDTVQPALSAVLYRTQCADWSPERFADGIPGIDDCEQVYRTISAREHVLIVVTARREPVEWTGADGLGAVAWDLYCALWLPERQLLFINASANAGEYKLLARALCGDDVTLVNEEEVFRVFARVNRLRLQNVGLSERLGRNIRYTGRMGSDVDAALSEVARRGGQKAVLAGTGFEDGHVVTVGASRRGRIWTMRRDNVAALAAWCKHVGAKVLDTTIDAATVLRGTLTATTVETRPAVMPIAADWPERMYRQDETLWWFERNGRQRSLAELSIQLRRPSVDGPLRVEIVGDDLLIGMELSFVRTGDALDYRWTRLESDDAIVRNGRAARPMSLEDFFYEDPPVLWFADGSCLEGNHLVALQAARPPYDPTKLVAWDWSGTNIRKESQGTTKDATTVQARVIRELLASQSYVAVVDDDGKGELADVVAVRVEGDLANPTALGIELYHCKYAHGDKAGARLEDLYEVCGQAQKCISWMASPARQVELFTHLLRREAKRRAAQKASRIELGDQTLLMTLREICKTRPVRMSVAIVQPGLSCTGASREQLELLSVTEHYLLETYQLPFTVIGSNA